MSNNIKVGDRVVIGEDVWSDDVYIVKKLDKEEHSAYICSIDESLKFWCRLSHLVLIRKGDGEDSNSCSCGAAYDFIEIHSDWCPAKK